MRIMFNTADVVLATHQVKGRPQVMQTLVGRSALLGALVFLLSLPFLATTTAVRDLLGRVMLYIGGDDAGGALNVAAAAG